MRKWVASLEPPIGITAINDKVARYVMNAVLELGLRIPEDVAVVGLENEEVVCLNPAPSSRALILAGKPSEWRPPCSSTNS